jgi:hypothetical protein
MYKKTFLFLALVLICFQSFFGQKNLFEGSAMYEDKKSMKCELDIKIDSSYRISGNLSREIGDTAVHHMITGESYMGMPKNILSKLIGVSMLRM